MDFVLTVSERSSRRSAWSRLFARMESLDAPGNCWPNIRVVGYALSVAQRNLQQEDRKSPEDALCMGPQVGAVRGGPGPRLVLTALPLPAPTPGEGFALLRSCCVTFCLQN